METYLVYIGKAAVGAGAFYLAYLLLFQHQKHFGFNRIYLPVSLALSFIIPLITFTTTKYIELVNFDVNSFAYLAPASGEIQQPVFVLEWYHYLFGMYLLGAGGFLFHLLLGHLKAIKIVKQSTVQQKFGAKVNVTKKDVHPFSFFTKIVIAEKTLSHPELEMIVSHEKIHVREKHTLDILFTEVMFLLQWFNPFAWLLKDAVKSNLEYKTDHEIVKQFNAQEYQLAMVSLAGEKGVAPFLTALNGSQLKNRIVMMKKKTENKFAVVKQLAVLPILAILVMGLSNKKVKTEIIPLGDTISVKITGKAVIEKETKVSGNVVDEKGKPLSGVSVIVKGTITGTITDDKGNFKLLIDDKAEILIFSLYGFESVEIAAQHGKTQEIELELKSNKNAKPNEIVVVGYGTQKSESSSPAGYSISGGMNGSIQKGSENLTITPSTQNGLTIKSGGDPAKQPLYIVDGTEIKSVENLNPEEIERIEVLKDQSATAVYGDKGKNGVILITTKEKKIKGNPLVIVDGQEYKSMEEANVPPEDIVSISVLKGETASPKIYGEKAKDGVIVINTKTKYNSEKSEVKLEKQSISDLRKNIAWTIKYPVLAQENNQQGVVEIWAFVAKDGTISRITEKRPDGKFINVDEVVVTSYKSEKTVTSEKSKDLDLLIKESKRVIEKLSPITISELQGEMVCFRIKFVLQ